MEDRLHPELKSMFAGLPEVIYTRENLEEKRMEMQQFAAAMAATLPVHEGVLTSERYIPCVADGPDVRIKIYEPREKKGALPGLLYIHGGGYILGSADMMDPAMKQMVSELECIIVSVDYRLAPEHPYPAPLEDCYAALKWFADHAEQLGGDNSRIAVMGPSAGGGLTAALSLLARDRQGPAIMFQMPLYPMIDDRMVTPSSQTITDDRVWSKAKTELAWSLYLGEREDGAIDLSLCGPGSRNRPVRSSSNVYLRWRSGPVSRRNDRVCDQVGRGRSAYGIPSLPGVFSWLRGVCSRRRDQSACCE